MVATKWFVEEELIEWLSADYLRARETRLISPKGEVVARRLASQAAVWESCLVLQNNRCIAYRDQDAEPLVGATCVVPRDLKISSNLSLFLYKWDFDLQFLDEWKLVDETRSPHFEQWGLFSANWLTTSIYQAKAQFRKPRSVVWKVYQVSEPLGGYPILRELIVDHQLYRRHRLLYRRSASRHTREHFQLPRGIRLKPTSISDLLRSAETVPFNVKMLDTSL
jgi:hypothetical protein